MTKDQGEVKNLFKNNPYLKIPLSKIENPKISKTKCKKIET